ncbi:thioredoxin family protein [Flavisolibacter ginsenosidimutans]|uniref:Thioredoxin family protein n=1 Tax=Flavisolibacter ginsenosidimutans TaxID=661481 RepID=A0A5B8UQI8_9BACT|nr:thioredoxin family protein [Flavisolibacter ginsenosidimutans]QEC58250.1 thioredoxin family protein [Flavisolibacter ginsenosidimutans]
MRYLFILALFVSLQSFASDSTKLYNLSANVKKDIATALSKAKKEGKHVLIQVGGNWCIWCYRFHDFVEKDTALNRIENESYVVYHLNYSKENKNLEALKSFGFPQRFGFPVFVILDANGNRLHTQDSSLLEEGKGYNAQKVKSFFEAWSPAALNEKNYKE